MRYQSRLYVGISIIALAVVSSLQAATPIIWFNADVGVTVDSSGSNVVRWADQSGLNNDATQTALTPGNQPTLVTNALNGHSVLRFDSGVHDYLSLTNNKINLTTGLSIFIVAKNAARQNYNGLFRIGPAGSPFNASSDLDLYWQLGTTDAGSGNAEYVSNRDGYPSNFAEIDKNDSKPAINSYYLYDVIATTPSGTMRINASPGTTFPGSNNFLPTNSNWAAIGVGYGGGGNALNGDIAEIIVYNTALTAAERNQVAGSLADKYGLTIPEPSSVVLMTLAFLFMVSRRRR